MKTIKLLGGGCPSCRKVEKRIRKVLEKYGIEAELIKVTDYQEMMRYNIRATPTVVLDEEVKIHGRIPPEKELIELLT